MACWRNWCLCDDFVSFGLYRYCLFRESLSSRPLWCKSCNWLGFCNRFLSLSPSLTLYFSIQTQYVHREDKSFELLFGLFGYVVICCYRNENLFVATLRRSSASICSRVWKSRKTEIPDWSHLLSLSTYLFCSDERGSKWKKIIEEQKKRNTETHITHAHSSSLCLFCWCGGRQGKEREREREI
jgi:hypothetical protein